MPLKSQAQRAWMHIHHPKMAARWEKHTPKGKLPKHVGEANMGVQKVQKPSGEILEMPHFDSEPPVDLRIERYPMDQAQKGRLMQDFQRVGLAGMKDGKWLHFRPDHTFDEINAQQAAELPKLPKDWEKYALIAKGDSPKMSDVFGGKTK